MLREGELRYIDIRKSPEINGSSRLQLPGNIVDLRGLPNANRIYTGADLFKYRRQNGDALDQSARDKGPFGAFSPSQLTLSLLKGANLSTALHELGHFFFETDADLASQLIAQQREGASAESQRARNPEDCGDAAGKDSGKIPISRMLREGELRYIDTRKSPEINGSSGHQLPNNIVDLRGLPKVNRIYTGADLFKHRSQNGDETKRRYTADALGELLLATAGIRGYG